ncbi:MAG: S46 family peptidase [Bacteroidales bacterium]|nr:S46 family peptidase [Bacteroidales bacterium]
MKIRKKITVALVLWIIAVGVARPEEGMWIPLLLKKYNIEQMHQAGFKLNADDIYSINHASLKDAIVRFGGGCTGEVISDQGLLITNHHCGFGSIQRHSSLEHDYLTDGFWAMNRDEELPNPGLSVTFLIRIEDVTAQALQGVTDGMEPQKRNSVVADNNRKIREEAVRGTHYTARVAPFFDGNQYFLFVYEIFRDIRLVGAPPSAIGKFGGETDNWIWPRHTGDFSLFRIYADKNNQPAGYNPDNVPYHPRKHLPVSIRGIQKGDFTMVFGYPGRTAEYIPSFRIEQMVNYTIPASIELRTQRLDIIMAAMETSPKIRIQYAAKKSGIANGWKKNQGILKGLKRLDAIEKKKNFEASFQNWADQNPDRRKKYGNLLRNYREVIERQSPYSLAYTYSREAGFAAEIIGFAGQFSGVIMLFNEGKRQEAKQLAERLTSRVDKHFKDYHAPTDQKLLASLLHAYATGIDTSFQPGYLKEMSKKYQGDFNHFARDVFKHSILTDKKKVLHWLSHLNGLTIRKLEKDPAYLMNRSINELLQQVIMPGLKESQIEIPDLQRRYMEAQMEMQPDKLFYPDANGTIRVTYGKVDDFSPGDAVRYKFYTTLKGIMEKDNPDIYDYRVPEKLKELYRQKEYGRYGQNGEMPVCFIASNHTSGGNSGSPVLNAEGALIGVNFDRNWEGTMSDLMYDPNVCRNISIDIRYALFLIDKFAGAHHLIDEMEIVQ